MYNHTSLDKSGKARNICITKANMNYYARNKRSKINDLKPNMNERNAIKQVKSRDEKIAYNRA